MSLVYFNLIFFNLIPTGGAPRRASISGSHFNENIEYYLQNHSIFLCTKLNNHLLSMDCNVVSQLKMVGYGCTTEGMHYATHFGRRNTNFFSVKSYNITQQSSTFNGNNKTILFTTKKGQLRLYDRRTALRNAIWVS